MKQQTWSVLRLLLGNSLWFDSVERQQPRDLGDSSNNVEFSAGHSEAEVGPRCDLRPGVKSALVHTHNFSSNVESFSLAPLFACVSLSLEDCCRSIKQNRLACDSRLSLLIKVDEQDDPAGWQWQNDPPARRPSADPTVAYAREVAPLSFM